MTETAQTAQTPSITITNAIARDSREALAVLSGEPLRASTAFRLKTIIKQIEDPLKTFEEIRLGLCKECGVLNEKTNFFDIAEDKRELFAAQIADLESAEITLQVKPIKLVDLGDAKISASVLYRLDWLITE